MRSRKTLVKTTSLLTYLIGSICAVGIISFIYHEGCFGERKEVRETSAGFYLYDASGEPIFNDQQVQAESDGHMDFNVECVNACEVDLNYSLVVLINDCYQEVAYRDGKAISQTTGMIQSGESKIVNVQFDISSYDRGIDNELRIILFYYEQKIPEDPLEQVVVGYSVGIYSLAGTIVDENGKRDSLKNGTEYSVSESTMQHIVWCAEDEVRSYPKFDYILDIGDEETVYFGFLGEEKKYVGMIFQDGSPIQIEGDCVFKWQQREGNIWSFKIDKTWKGTKTIFAYVYEQGAGWEQSYITNLYAVNIQGEE